MRRHKHRPPSPGELLKRNYLERYEISQTELAQHIGVDIKVINRIANGRCSITPAVAVKLAYALRTPLDFWLKAQNAVDLYDAERRIRRYPTSLL